MKQVDMFGVPARVNPAGGLLAQAFILPPFTVLNAREGWWQERKRAWLALGIRSELGRGGDLTAMGGGNRAPGSHRPGGGYDVQSGRIAKAGDGL